MAEIQDLNVTDASNIARWPENMQFSAVNDAGRADEGLLARWYKDMDASVTASGSSNAFTATSNRTISSLVNNTIITWTANHTISGASTLNLNGLGAKNIKRFNGDALASGDITSGQPVTTIYKSSPDQWYMMTAAASLATAGTFFDFTENAAPGTPAVNVARFYAQDISGSTWLFWNDSDGNARQLVGKATQANMEAENLFLGPTAATQKYHPMHPKAWGRSDSSGNIVGTAPGVSSISRTGTGLFTVTLSDTYSTFIVVGSIVNATGSGVGDNFQWVTGTSATFQARTCHGSTLTDFGFTFAVFGDLP